MLIGRIEPITDIGAGRGEQRLYPGFLRYARTQHEKRRKYVVCHTAMQWESRRCFKLRQTLSGQGSVRGTQPSFGLKTKLEKRRPVVLDLANMLRTKSFERA